MESKSAVTIIILLIITLLLIVFLPQKKKGIDVGKEVTREIIEKPEEKEVQKPIGEVKGIRLGKD